MYKNTADYLQEKILIDMTKAEAEDVLGLPYFKTPTTKEIQDNIKAYNTNAFIAMEAKIKELREFQSMTNIMSNKVIEKVPAIEEVLSKLGLSISEFHFRKTGTGIWEAKDQMVIIVSAIPTNDKFKFLKTAGYTKSGAGRNQLQLSTKAGKLASTIKKATGLQTSVNEFSLEAAAENETKRVLISMWVNQ